jgi:hypothetical protein
VLTGTTGGVGCSNHLIPIRSNRLRLSSAGA